MSAARKITYSFPQVWRADAPDVLRRVRERPRLRIHDPGPVRAYRAADLRSVRRPNLAAIAAVQGKTAVNDNSGSFSSLSFTWTSDTTAGNFLVVVIGWDQDPGTVTVPAAYTQRGTQQGDTSHGFSRVYTAVNAASISHLTSQVFSFTNGAGLIQAGLAAQEYSGVATASVVDGTDAYHLGATTSVTGGAVTTTNANDLLLGSVWANDGGISSTAITLTQSGSWVIRIQAGSQNVSNPSALRIAILDQIVAATSTYTAAVTTSRAVPYVVGTLATKAAGGGAAAVSGMCLLGVGP